MCVLLVVRADIAHTQRVTAVVFCCDGHLFKSTADTLWMDFMTESSVAQVSALRWVCKEGAPFSSHCRSEEGP